ncbi:DUF2948 family protein [Pelagibius sp.]|uniref:DUF2948 family protein n=1 Tax=Pelagibius sp. TaxID=1931238 RepID=UPI002630F011|nr:DUF2948 family protein [Pelagibius sp.]
MAESPPLKLRARDPEDMDVIAALLQDALVPRADMTFLPKEKRFVMVANRFQWPKEQDDPAAREAPSAPEATPEGEDVRFDDSDDPPPFERVNCGVCFDKVEKVRFRGLGPGKDEILNLLTITTQPRAITLLFSGDAAVRLDVQAVRCHLEDLGQPWPTRWRPEHERPEHERPEHERKESEAPSDS